MWAHGALGNISETDQDVADAIVRGVKAVDSKLAYLAIACSAQVKSAEKFGVKHFAEIFADRAYTEVPLDGMRRTIAARLTEAKQTIPHFYLTADVGMDRLLSLRE